MVGADYSATINEAVTCADLNDEAILLDATNGLYYGLDPVGSRIWTLLSEGHSSAQIARQLAHEYDAPLARIQADVDGFLAQLQAKGLVTMAGR